MAKVRANARIDDALRVRRAPHSSSVAEMVSRRWKFWRSPPPPWTDSTSTMILRLARSLSTSVGRVRHDDRGVSATIVAIALPVIIGFGALGAETGVWFTIKMRNQSAADAAAISAAYEVIAGKTDIFNDLMPATSDATARNGYTGTAPVVSYPYNDGIVGNGVAVTLQQTEGALLAAAYLSSVTVVNKAVAIIEVLNNPCILALGTASTDVEIAASTSLVMPNCSIAANSISTTAIELHSSSSVTAKTLVTVGEISVQGTPIDLTAPPSEFILATPPMIGAPPLADPYASILTHGFLIAGMPMLTRCTPSGLGAGAVIYSGNCFIQGVSLRQSSITLRGNTQISGDWIIQTNQIVDLSPGTYWITGNLTIQSSAVLKCSTCNNGQGTGVTLILSTATNTVGAISAASGAILNLNAPSSGRFPGLLIIQDSNGLPAGTTYSSLSSTIGGAYSTTLNGLIYFPKSWITFHGDPSAIGPRCLLLVAGAVNVDATSGLDVGGCPSMGLTLLPAVRTVALVE
jgi:Flp pilus assembly protein TadG